MFDDACWFNTLIQRDIYKNIRFYNRNLAEIKVNEKYGFYDFNRKKLIEPRFDKIQRFFGELCAAEIDGKWGYINCDGEWVIFPKFDYACNFEECLPGFQIHDRLIYTKIARVIVNEKWGLIDDNGNWLASPNFDKMDVISEGLICAKFKGEWGYLNRSGEWAIEPKYYDASEFRRGYAKVQLTLCNYLWIDHTGKEYKSNPNPQG